ncbi:hypothetical protein LTR84_012473 [Exophiala bonariae]|uniref:ATPase AAA-type core domain-containing protein n=1 Tax=Exophiala bonariae TaxID=1690606 RepID=A0AAV9NDZ7_9EURO|nr:hypothetical protein LTR84_012473 [Exophiala bonariae]
MATPPASAGQNDAHIVEASGGSQVTSLNNHDTSRPSALRDRDRLSRKKAKQKQFQRALASMLESFPGIFEESDADVSDLDDDHFFTDPAVVEEKSPESQSDRGSASPPLRERQRVRYRRGDRARRSPSSRSRDSLDEILKPLEPGRDHKSVSNETELGPIQYESELWNYARTTDKDYDIPTLIHTARTPAPLKVSKIGVHAKATETGDTNCIFKAVNMYAAPKGSVARPWYPDRPNEYLDNQYSYGRPEEPAAVTASVGSYILIYSETIMRAIRSCVKVYPGLSWAVEFMSVPAPYTLLVHYRDDLKAWNDKLSDEVASPITEQNNDNLGATKASLPPKEHIPLLLDFVFTPEFTAIYDHEMSLRSKPVPTCTYSMAWLLFCPGTMIYAWSDKSLDAYMVDSYELDGLYAGEVVLDRRRERTKTNQGLADVVKPPNGIRGEIPEFSTTPKSLKLKLHYVEYDGTRLGRRPKTVTIRPFEGEREISSLAAYPVQYAPDQGLRDQLIARGQKYLKLCQRHYMSYHGDTIGALRQPSRKLTGRVMIDSTMYYNDPETSGILRLKMPTADGITMSETDSDSNLSSGASDYARRRKRRVYARRLKELKKTNTQPAGAVDYDMIEPHEAKLKPEHFMLLPAQIWGFVLRERRWYLLHIDGLTEPQFQENIINDLVLKDEARILIEALSSTNDQTNEGFNHWSADIVQNKGEGRIFLLHGKPGVGKLFQRWDIISSYLNIVTYTDTGKTSTAECVAEANRAPLLAITCGDLGTHPNEVERSLMRWFRLATMWKAVLLLDEADVYLESRMSGDLARNSLVSIFLRALEYYQGVLFLTTNRVGTFDEAMLSRIHVVLHYADFEDIEREKIWNTSFRKLGEERPEVQIGRGVMDYVMENQRVLDLKWNGREIRNAFNTIVALAEFDAEKKRRAGSSNVQISIERSHLVQVVKMSEGFKTYMKSTRGLDESALAKALKIRDDAVVQMNQSQMGYSREGRVTIIDRGRE